MGLCEIFGLKGGRQWRCEGAENEFFESFFLENKYVLEALNIIKKELPNIIFKWTIVGQGNEYNEIVNKIKEYNLVNNVKIIKELTQPQVLEHLKKNDIFIMPSYYEGLGIVYLEAMNLGLITIGCTNQGISELFDSFFIMLKITNYCKRFFHIFDLFLSINVC